MQQASSPDAPPRSERLDARAASNLVHLLGEPDEDLPRSAPAAAVARGGAARNPRLGKNELLEDLRRRLGAALPDEVRAEVDSGVDAQVEMDWLLACPGRQ